MNPSLHIVTGVSKGLGKALALSLLANGDCVIGLARNSPAITHKNFRFHSLDLSDLSVINNLLQTILADVEFAKFQQVSLINNAALVTPIAWVDQLQHQQTVDALQVNLTSPVLLCTQFSQIVFPEQCHKLIVNVSSGAASSPLNSWSLYCSAKAGLHMFTNVLQQEKQADPHWRVLSYDPGIMDTSMQADIRSTPKDHFQTVDQFIDYQASGQLKGPAEVAEHLAQLIGESTARK